MIDDKRRLEQAEFYQKIYSGTVGWMCICWPRDSRFYKYSGWEHKFFKYPENLNLALDCIQYSYEHVDVYHCAHLFMDPTYRRLERRGSACVKENAVLSFRTAWADLDEIEPTATRTRPDLVVETSPKRYQAYWLLSELAPGPDVEELNHKIINDARQNSTDKSGWCITKRLRVPWTINHKARYLEMYGYKPEVALWP